jgi:5-bromo-4-chloroindolyl phosphate hydrolysis protein
MGTISSFNFTTLIIEAILIIWGVALIRGSKTAPEAKGPKSNIVAWVLIAFGVIGLSSDLSLSGVGYAAIFIIGGAVILIKNRKKITGASSFGNFGNNVKEKRQKIKATGLNKGEAEFFCNTMDAANDDLVLWASNIKESVTLKEIEDKSKGLKAGVALYDELMSEPRKLAQADKFLYSHLPNVVALTSKFVEINKHVVESESSSEVIKDAAQAIEDVSCQIADDYTRFVSDDLDDINLQISIAKQNIELSNYIKEKIENEQ